MEFKGPETPEGHETYYLMIGRDLENDGTTAIVQCSDDWSQIYTDVEWEDKPLRWIIHRKVNAPKVPTELIMEEIEGKTTLSVYNPPKSEIKIGYEATVVREPFKEDDNGDESNPIPRDDKVFCLNPFYEALDRALNQATKDSWDKCVPQKGKVK